MPPTRVARVLIVDDSAVMRSLLRTVVSSDARMEVAGTAPDGAAALRVIDTLRPDLVLMDVEMPVMDGVRTLKEMRAQGRKTPVIMCSTLTQRGAKVTIEALASGASDYVAKPTGMSDRQAAIEFLARDLVPKILALTGDTQHASVSSAFSGPPRTSPLLFNPLSGGVSGGAARPAPISPTYSPAPIVAPAALQPMSNVPPSAVVIGVSTGGPAALDVLLPLFPATFPIPILIVQHMPELFTKLLAERLDSRCKMRVCEPANGDPVRPGVIYIARGNWHMEVVPAPGSGYASGPFQRSGSIAATLRLTQEAPENHCRPAADVLFRTAAQVYGPALLAVVLTGMGSDGMIGCRTIREQGGNVLAQDQATSAVWGMPGAVANAGLAHKVLPLSAIAPEILRLAGRSQQAFAQRETAG